MRRAAIALSLAGIFLALPAARAQDGRGGNSGPSALGTDVRLDQLEDQQRQLIGQIEQLQNAINQLGSRLDKLSSDVDLRLNALEHAAPPAASPAPASAAPAGPPPKGAANAATPPSPPPSGSMGTGNGVLGTLPAGEAPGGANAATTATSGVANPPAATPATPQDQYNHAFGLLQRADYPNAETALRAFVKQFPKDPLAGNAQYWLGETYYVRKDWNDAAIAFAEGYQKYPKSSKAMDDLLKLGMSLANLGQKSNACASYARLDHDFPAAPAPIKERNADEQKKAGC
ncbi:MAG: tol-pal system protein YbgF [Stellaceae bacterium]|jgi:tol-pal system protein YbgF